MTIAQDNSLSFSVVLIIVLKAAKKRKKGKKLANPRNASRRSPANKAININQIDRIAKAMFTGLLIIWEQFCFQAITVATSKINAPKVGKQGNISNPMRAYFQVFCNCFSSRFKFQLKRFFKIFFVRGSHPTFYFQLKRLFIIFLVRGAHPTNYKLSKFPTFFRTN